MNYYKNLDRQIKSGPVNLHLFIICVYVCVCVHAHMCVHSLPIIAMPIEARRHQTLWSWSYRWL